ncbi:MAG TPA: hypothetical protein VK701_08115 [Solirubrobacteraceae bacterium]|nr:hypothetical protein [Solirubrobacteraceae bacterium]
MSAASLAAARRAGVTAAAAGRPQRSLAASPGTSPPATMDASFTPDRLGAPTSVSFRVDIDPPALVPPPLQTVEVFYPRTLGLATSGLGLASCSAALLLSETTAACPANSRMGSGSALVEVPFGPETVSEHVTLQIYAAPSSDGYLHLDVLAHGAEPVFASIVITGILLPGRLQLSIPPIPSLPGAPYASVVIISASLGANLTYLEHVHGRLVPYHPRGIGLPDSCPRGGFRLGASFSFTDGQRSLASTAVPCPTHRAH